MTEKERKKQMLIIIGKMFEIAGLQFKESILEEPYWYNKYTMTEEQDDRFREWLIDYVRKMYRLSKRAARIEASMVILNYGLRINNKNPDADGDIKT